jgi:hypothetical protein
MMIVPLAAIGLLAGCNQSDNTSSTSSDSSGRASRDDNAAVSRTSRNDTNTTSRVYSQDSTNSNLSKPADNTGRNVRDRSNATLTPEEQGSSDSDRDLTRNIRRAISTNDQFSVLAKNIKIVTLNGKVTLRGPVENQQEQQAILSTAKKVAAGATVDNQLEVKTTNQ